MNTVIIKNLTEYPLETFLNCGALAQIMQVCPRTLRRMVLRYELPQGIRQGKQKLWSIRLLLEWYRRREAENIARAEQERERIRRYEEGA